MQHIVLMVRATPEWLGVYEPARDHEVPMNRDDFLAGIMSVAGWARPGLAMLPR